MAKQRHILLINDDLHVRQALGEALTDENYQVALAANGSEAVRHLRQAQVKIDAVLLDLRLGLENGWKVILHLTRLQPGLPVIVMSGARGEQAPFRPDASVTVMEKPLDLRRLFETLRHLTAQCEPIQQRIGSRPRDTQDRSAV